MIIAGVIITMFYSLTKNKSKSVHSIKYDGLYIGHYIGYNQSTNGKFNITFYLKFNENGLSAYYEDEDNPEIPLDTLRETAKEISKINTYEHFENLAKYKIIENNKIQMKFYEPENPYSLGEKIFNENCFFEWSATKPHQFSGKICLDNNNLKI